MADHQLLTVETHRDVRIAPGHGEPAMSCLVVPTEFRQVQDDFPILFRLGTDRETFTALAIFGFEPGENLFLDGDRWDARYVPLAIAIQPFLIGGMEAAPDRQVHIDMADPRVGGAEGVRLFDDYGRTTPYLDDIAEKLGALDEGYRGTAAFFAALRRHELLEPLTLEITLDDGSTNRLVGFHAIDEAKLQALDAAALGELHAAGHLLPIFMAVASVGRLNELVARKNLAVRRG